MLFSLLLLLPVSVTSCQSVEIVAQPPVAWHPTYSPSAATTQTLNLEQCLHLALERQPRVAAQRASLAVAERARVALETLRFPACLDPQIPIRCRQAALGVSIAAAGVDQAEREAVYAVTRTYFTVLYAREQERVGRGVVEHLTNTRAAAQQALDDGVRDVSATDVQRTEVYLHLAEARQTQAAQGVKRALVALREALGLEPCVSVDVPDERLPEPEARPCRDELVALALARRGELIQAGLFAQTVCLEIDAQATTSHQRMQTFASGADAHARQVAQGVHNNDYRPGAVPPEIPPYLIGTRPERLEQARALQARAETVTETSRNLIILETEDAFLRWEEESGQARQARKAAETGDKLAEQLRKDFAANLKVKVDEVVSARVLASQARSELNEHLYRQILALADLERMTAGGFCAGLTRRTIPPTEPSPKKDAKKDTKQDAREDSKAK
jgi:outer membrane protein TolC